MDYKNSKNGSITTDTATTLSALDALVNAASANYDSNTDLSIPAGYKVITWKWDFDNSGAGTYDKQDTILGDLIADTTNNYDVVVKRTAAGIDTYYPVTVADKDATTGEILVTVNTGSGSPTTVANLGVAYNASVTVTQLD